jgi:hypothetical protein
MCGIIGINGCVSGTSSRRTVMIGALTRIITGRLVQRSVLPPLHGTHVIRMPLNCCTWFPNHA